MSSTVQRAIVTLSVAAVGGLWALPAQADVGGGPSQDILLLLGVVGAAYVITHLLLERIQRRFGIVSGVEYIVLGVLVGPVFGFMDGGTLVNFTPAIVMGTGSLGLLAGLNLKFRVFTTLDFEALRVALWLSFVTFCVMVVLPLGVMVGLMPFEQVLQWMPGLVCVGAIATAADSGPVESLHRFLGARGGATAAAIRVAKLCSAMAVVAFGLLFCMFDHESVYLPRDYGMVEWFAIHVAMGGALGALFAVFLRRELTGDKLITIVIGMVIFTSGIAYYLRLSPIFVNLILGLVLTNTTTHSIQVERLIGGIERPLYILLFFFAGATVYTQAPLWGLMLALPYLVLRSGAKLVAGIVATRTTSPELEAIKIPPLGRVMLAPGGLSAAILLDFSQVFGSLPAGALVYNTMIVAIVLSEIFSYVRARSWLLDHTDVPSGTIQQVLTGGRDGDIQARAEVA